MFSGCSQVIQNRQDTFAVGSPGPSKVPWVKAPLNSMRQSSTYHQPWQLLVNLSGNSWSMCLFYWWSHNQTSCEAGLGEVQPTRSASFPAWKTYVSLLILVIRPRSWVSYERPQLKPCCSRAMMMLSYTYCMMLLMTLCKDLALVADDTCEGDWLELFLKGSVLKDRCGSPIFRHSAATKWGIDDQGHSRGNFVLLLVMSATISLK